MVKKHLVKKIKWRWDYGLYIPFCPYCDEPAFDDIERCSHCGKEYKWVEGKHKPTVIEHGEYKVVQTTNKHIHIYTNGKLVFHASCTKKKSKRELLEYLDFYKSFTAETFDKIYSDDDEE